jgi:hypothetical protein
LRLIGELEVYFTSVMRMYDYTLLESEEPLVKEQDFKVLDIKG